MALWKARALSPEQKVQIAEEESGARTLQGEEIGSFLVLEDANMSEVFSSAVDVDVSCFPVIYTFLFSRFENLQNDL